jgi:hypothetical protein
MKLMVTEKQLKLILSTKLPDGEIKEDAATPPSSGGGTGYPTVGKWESGVTRGPGNQIDDKVKWSDILKINRGKANPLV